jgi:tetratricopeptide (TPR) repeat protein
MYLISTFLSLVTVTMIAFAQERSGRVESKTDVYVFLVDSNFHPVEGDVRLVGQEIVRNASASRGHTVFSGVPSGPHQLEARSSPHGERRTHVSLSGAESFHFEMIRLGSEVVVRPHEQTISVTELQVPEHVKDTYRKGLLSLQRRDWQQAKEHFAVVIKDAPLFARGYNALGVTLTQLGELDAAGAALQQAITVDSRYSEAYLNLAFLYGRLNDAGLAKSILHRVLAFDPNNVQALFRLLAIELERQEFEAVTAKVAEIHANGRPHNRLTHIYAAKAYSARKMKAETETQLSLFHSELNAEFP